MYVDYYKYISPNLTNAVKHFHISKYSCIAASATYLRKNSTFSVSSNSELSTGINKTNASFNIRLIKQTL